MIIIKTHFIMPANQVFRLSSILCSFLDCLIVCKTMSRAMHIVQKHLSMMQAVDLVERIVVLRRNSTLIGLKMCEIEC
jgi:hypothetical protein